MKILVIGDPHFKIDNIPEVECFIEGITKLANEECPDLIVCLGDILHTHERIHTMPLNKAYDFIDQLSAKAEMYILVGNHDYINNQQFLSKNHWMNGLKNWKNVTIVDEVKQFQNESFLFTFVSYVPPGRFEEALKTAAVDWKQSTCIFAHQELYGCKMGLLPSIEGDRWLSEHPLVISGHIHGKHKLAENIIYVGAPFQHTFDEVDEKTVSIFTFDGHDYNQRDVDLHLPRKITVSIDLNNALASDIDCSKENKIKINLEGNMDDFKAFKKTEKYKELVNKGAKVIFKVKEEKREKSIKGCFKDILEDLVNKEKNPYLTQSYERIVKDNVLNVEDIMFL